MNSSTTETVNTNNTSSVQRSTTTRRHTRISNSTPGRNHTNTPAAATQEYYFDFNLDLKKKESRFRFFQHCQTHWDNIVLFESKEEIKGIINILHLTYLKDLGSRYRVQVDTVAFWDKVTTYRSTLFGRLS